VRLTYDHKGSDSQEAKRITDAGGFVMNNRVNGGWASPYPSILSHADMPLSPQASSPSPVRSATRA
jgi:serine/threonine protein phosphatase PrpC